MQDHLPDSPPPLLSDRLELKAYSLDDAAWVARLAADVDVVRYTGLPHPMDEAVAVRWLEERVEGVRGKTAFAWGAWLRGIGGDPDPIGGVSLRFPGDSRTARLGFWLGKDYWGQRLGSEMVEVAVHYAMVALKLDRLVADCAGANEASARLMLGLGMREGPRQPAAFDRFGSVHDVRVFELCPVDWRP